MPDNEISPDHAIRADSTLPSAENTLTPVTATRSVSMYEVHLFVEPYLAAAGDWPVAGTLAWQHLSDDDPRKLAAVLDGGRRDALRWETDQDNRAQAAHAISAAENWPQVAQRVRDRADFLTRNPWAQSPRRRERHDLTRTEQ